jgi:hypothetical protein
VEFIVICFDDNNEVSDWIHNNFESELNSGYLQFYQHDDMKNWHFGKAKNAFKKYINGKIYSSLDGDNFTGYRAGKFIFETFKDFNYQCVFHQFQGDYGDGTCGRISLNRDDYLTWGYDNTFLPRQWDELDALLSVLANNIGKRTLLCYPGEEKNIINKSYPFRRFLKENDCVPPVKVMEIPESLGLNEEVSAVGAHDSSYVGNNNDLRLPSQFNHLSSFIKNCKNAKLVKKYTKELYICQDEFLTGVDETKLEKWFFDKDTIRETNQEHDKIIILYLSNKTHLDLQVLQELYPSTLLIIIGRNIPEKAYRLLNNVIVYHPIVGIGEISHMFWINIAAKIYGKNKMLSVFVDEQCLKSYKNLFNHKGLQKIGNSFFEYNGKTILKTKRLTDRILTKLKLKSES